MYVPVIFLMQLKTGYDLRQECKEFHKSAWGGTTFRKIQGIALYLFC